MWPNLGGFWNAWARGFDLTLDKGGVVTLAMRLRLFEKDSDNTSCRWLPCRCSWTTRKSL